jgi:DtxR family transcriptional regulator, Mn-dependent transcriptional regulator
LSAARKKAKEPVQTEIQVPQLSLSAPVEDYLKAIYELELHGDAAATNDIAARLSIAPPSVSGMVRKLKEQGLVTHAPYRGVRLTAEGRRAALGTIRRHRVIETYLATVLGYPWDRVHAEAERLEHAASEELVDRMAAALGEPSRDPHGAPIPTREGSVADEPRRSLAELEPGETAHVVSVQDDDDRMLRYLDELGLRPGARVTVRERAPFEGPIELVVDGVRQIVGARVLATIGVDGP